MGIGYSSVAVGVYLIAVATGNFPAKIGNYAPGDVACAGVECRNTDGPVPIADIHNWNFQAYYLVMLLSVSGNTTILSGIKHGKVDQ